MNRMGSARDLGYSSGDVRRVTRSGRVRLSWQYSAVRALPSPYVRSEQIHLALPFWDPGEQSPYGPTESTHPGHRTPQSHSADSRLGREAYYNRSLGYRLMVHEDG